MTSSQNSIITMPERARMNEEKYNPLGEKDDGGAETMQKSLAAMLSASFGCVYDDTLTVGSVLGD